MSEKLILGFIGNGKSTNRYHAPFILTRRDTIQIKTVWARNLNKTDWARIDGVHYTENIDEVLNDPEIDVIDICTPPYVHKEGIIKAMKAGKHVICEKPLVGYFGQPGDPEPIGEKVSKKVMYEYLLKELEDTILNAEDKLYNLEYDLFSELRDYIAERLDRIQATAKAVALLDALCSLSYVGEQNGYVKPVFNEKNAITIKEGRHPVVEKVLQDTLFIPNDTILDNKSNQIAIITGPNMAGKSTYMRQTALIVLMAQIGSFVPAKSASIGVVDRIFTRVGASDDLASGQSTFMVEMNEVSNILRNATKNSLLILDEIGRGTSTFDGLAIAWAVIEHIANRNLLGAKTLFATHYHLLTELEEKMDNVKNYCIAVKEKGDDIVFLRKIIPGGTDRSYGIEVAKLAGVPDMVIERAKEILNELSAGDIASMIQDIDVTVRDGKLSRKVIKRQDEVDAGQLSFFDSITDAEIVKEIEEIDITMLTPLDGLNLLYQIQNKIKNRI